MTRQTQFYRALYHLFVWPMASLGFVLLDKTDLLTSLFRELSNPIAVITPILSGIILLGLASLYQRYTEMIRFRRVVVEEGFGTILALTSIAIIVGAYHFSTTFSEGEREISFCVVSFELLVQLIIWPRVGDYLLRPVALPQLDATPDTAAPVGAEPERTAN